MPSTMTDRLAGLTTSVAVKAPCRVATTANITLSGLQTIDGVALAAGERVLVKSQTSSVDNGVWVVASGAWTRARDFNGPYDAVSGSTVLVNGGETYADTFWKVTADDPFTIGTDAITFDRSVLITAEVEPLVAAAEAAAEAAALSEGNAADSEANAAISASEAESDATAATTQASIAVAAVSASGTPYPNTYASNLPKGVTSTTITAAGTGGTSGTYALGVSGGPTGFAGTYTISGGAVTAITITNPGLSTSTSAPTLSFPSGSVTGATATATVGNLILDQKTYWVASADSSQILLYGNNGGSLATAPFGGTQLVLYGKAAMDALVASAQASAGQVATGLGALAATSASTIGASTATSNMASGFITASGDIVTADSLVTSIAMSWSASATVDLLVVDAISRKVRNVVTGFSVASGVTTLSNPFGSFIVPANSLIAVRRTAGTGLLQYGATGNSGWKITDASYAIGDTVPALVTWGAGVVPYMSIALSTISDSLDGRLDALERETPGLQAAARGEAVEASRSLSIGYYGLTVSATITSPFMCGVRLHADCLVTGLKINCSAAGTGFLELWRRIDGAWQLAHRKFVTVASGDNTLTAPNWQANAGAYLAYRIYTGSGPTYQTGLGIGFPYIASPTNNEIGDTSTAWALNTGGTINMQAVVSVPKRRSYRATRAAVSGPNTVEYQQFAGTTAPSWWSGTGTTPFSVNNGLLSSGSGGWDKNTTWQPEGMGWSSNTKRRLSGRVVINDATSIVGICTQPRTTVSGDGGAVVMIDGTAGKLRLYHWTGTSTAGTLYTDIALTAALTAGRAYTLVVTRNEWTITAVLTDTVDGTVTTLTTTTANQAGRPRLHGRPGVVHISGDVKWEWLRFAHDNPRNVRAVVIGDSNGEGTALGGGSSWVTQINSSYGGIVNACRAGESAIDLVNRLSDLTDHRPQFAIMAMGTNDTNQTIWRCGVKAFIDAAEMIGAEPILVIPMPYVAKQSFITSLSSDITGAYFGRYRWIDLLGALSNANDRLTWYASYVAGDAVHATAAGQTRTVSQTTTDVPELVA